MRGRRDDDRWREGGRALKEQLLWIAFWIGTALLLAVVAIFVWARWFGDIHEAAESGQMLQMRVLLVAKHNGQHAKDIFGWTPLYWAVGYGHTDVAQLLLQAGADVNVRADDGLMPLHLAALGGETEVAGLLVARGADVHARDDISGWTPLYWAAAHGHASVAELLLAKGTDLNAKDRQGRTPLDIAAKERHTELVALLKKHGATSRIAVSIQGASAAGQAACRRGPGAPLKSRGIGTLGCRPDLFDEFVGELPHLAHQEVIVGGER